MKLFATIGALLFSGIVSATPLHNIVAFGDSLSDNGNLYEFMKHQLPPSPPYFKGRFSNGLLWIEQLTASYFPNDPAAHLQDYAFGGAGVSEEEGDDVLFTLRKEIETYLIAHDDKATADNLYVVWIGANNYLGMPSDIEQSLKDVNAGITHSLQRLADKGAKHILVLNLPDLGRTPAAFEFGSMETLTYFSNQHNQSLARTVADLKVQYPDVQWILYDLNTAFTYALEHPDEYGITNITNTCVGNNDESLKFKSVLRMAAHAKRQPIDGCTGYMFFDLVHPTALVHKIMGEKARLLLDAEGVTFAE